MRLCPMRRHCLARVITSDCTRRSHSFVTRPEQSAPKSVASSESTKAGQCRIRSFIEVSSPTPLVSLCRGPRRFPVFRRFAPALTGLEGQVFRNAREAERAVPPNLRPACCRPRRRGRRPLLNSKSDLWQGRVPLRPISFVDRYRQSAAPWGTSSSQGAAVAGLSHRQTEILNIARASGRVIVEDLARRFEVSAQTIRKDLNDLCDQRSLTRIHGGAIIASGVENLAYEARRFVAAEEKRAIGIAAASRIPNGCSLFINIGTTTEEVASALTSHEDLLVITNNLNVAMLLYRHPRIEVIVAGGAVRRADGAVIGSTAISLIGQFKVDYAIIGASAIDEEGALLDFDYREVQAAQAIIANARSVMLVANSTKLRRSAPVRIAHLSQIQTFVTDAALPSGLANICHSRGIDVVEAMDKPAADIDEPVGEAARFPFAACSARRSMSVSAPDERFALTERARFSARLEGRQPLAGPPFEARYARTSR